MATPYKLVTTEGVRTETLGGREILHVAPEALTQLTSEAMVDVSHLLRPGHLQQLRNILDDPESSTNDRFVALELLKNANIAAGMILPSARDFFLLFFFFCFGKCASLSRLTRPA